MEWASKVSHAMSVSPYHSVPCPIGYTVAQDPIVYGTPPFRPTGMAWHAPAWAAPLCRNTMEWASKVSHAMSVSPYRSVPYAIG